MTFQRGTTDEIAKIDMLDGQVLLDTQKKQILVDEENERNIYAGKENAIDINIGGESYNYNYYNKGKAVAQYMVGTNSNVYTILKTYSKLITDMSKRIYELEKDTIKKDELTWKLDDGDLYIDKSYE